MINLNRFVIFTLEEQKYALYLSLVEKIERAVEILPLPEMPDVVLGIINFHGRVIPVINLRKRFYLPEQNIKLNDQFIIAKTSKRSLALLVDNVTEVIEIPENKIVEAQSIVSDLKYVKGILKLDNGLIIIQDLENFLSLEEEKTIEELLKKI